MNLASFFPWARPKPAVDSDANRHLVIDKVPDMVYAVGDIHGCYDLYANLEAQIASLVAQNGGKALLILLGDLIDRGPKSAQVLDHILSPAPANITRLVLMGNHEEMFCSFVRQPRLDHEWLDYGGRETLQSYGLNLGDGRSFTKQRLRQAIDATIPKEHIDFLEALPLSVRMEQFFFSHAGANPDKPVAQQSRSDLLWGRPEVLDQVPFPLLCIHGHRPTPDAMGLITPARVNVDTGAYATGRLSAFEIVWLGSSRFLIAQNDQLT